MVEIQNPSFVYAAVRERRTPRFLKLQRRGFGLLTSPEPVQVVRPDLHHTSAFRPERRSVVGPPVGVPHRVGQLMLDEVRPEAQHFVQPSLQEGGRADEEALDEDPGGHRPVARITP